MIDFLFLLIPLFIGGILALIKSEAVIESSKSFKKWLGAQYNLIKDKKGIEHRFLLQPITGGAYSILSRLDNIRDPGLRAGAVISALIYAVFFATFILGVAISFFIYTIILLTLIGLTLWIINKTGMLNKGAYQDIKKIKHSSLAHALDLNKEEDIKLLEEESLLENNKHDKTEIDEFDLPKNKLNSHNNDDNKR